MTSSNLELLHQTPSQHILNPVLNKIPKTPIFLTTTYSRFLQAYKIRVKFWKLASCHINPIEPQRDTPGVKFTNFGHLLSTSTLKKSITSARKIKLIPPSFSEFYPERLFSKSWRLESLTLTLKNFNSFPSNFFNSHISHKISSISLFLDNQTSFPTPQEEIFILYFRKFLKKLPNKPQNTLTLFHQHLRFKVSLGKIHPLSPDYYVNSQTLIHLTILLIQESVEHLSLISNYLQTFKSTFAPFPHFSNLKSLNISLQGSHVSYQGLSAEKLDLTSLQKLQKLEILKISLDHIDVLDWDFLLSLQNLTNLSLIFKSYHSYLTDFPLPLLENLKTFTLHIKEDIEFDEESIRIFIENNSNLKFLELRASLEQINLIFQETTFLSLECLSIQICKVNFPLEDYIDDFEDIFQRHNHVKDLHINLYSCSELFSPVTKAIGTYGTALEALKIDFETNSGSNAKNYKRLKKLFGKITGLKSLELDLKHEEIEGKVFMKVIEGLKMLKNLERLVLKSTVVNMSERKEEKFREFAQSVRGLKRVEIKVNILKEISEEMTSEIDEEEEF